MGMGDVKLPYEPPRKPIRCDVSGKIFTASMVRKCHEEAVVRRYGTGGEANVSVWICRKCKHAIHYKFHGGLGCELERKLQTSKNSQLG